MQSSGITMKMNTTLYKHEMRMNKKSLLIWTLCVGVICFGCILLYTSLKSSVQEIADAFSGMGMMSAAIGLDKMSLATLEGYYATEIAMIHSLGGAMFAALLGMDMLSKEENGHTTEFLNVLTIERKDILFWKYQALLSNILLLNFVCTVIYFIAFAMMGEAVDAKEMILYHTAAALMQLEIGTVCFCLSAIVKRAATGVGLGITLLLFAADMMCRIVPAIENLKYVTPFYYANAADIFTDGKWNYVMMVTGVIVILTAYVLTGYLYQRKDL
ncbi:MAG: ABC transporter permease [Bacillus sp. (in: Bacteria)]|nr:ABC transporter permease [Bacillus sp. (in: firmicutes)]MCM1426583.1 ABC transporter permease [Eubacterium sp.]